MNTILVIDSAVSGHASVSKALVRETVDVLTRGVPARVIHRDLGRDINTFARREDVLLLAGMAFSESFYLEPWYLDTFATASYDSYRGMVDLKKKGALLADRVIALVPEGASPDFTRENLPKVRELGAVRIVEPESSTRTW